MVITYAQHAANPDRLWSIHGKKQDRVLGFLVDVPEQDQEILFKLDPFGDVRRTHVINRPNSEFYKAGRAWFAVDVIPDDAVFCGSYNIHSN